MFPLKANDPYIKETGERSTLGKIVGGGSDTPELPDYSIADAGKVLKVGDDGSLEWDEAGSGGGDAFLSYDFTKFGSFTTHGVEMSASGATFNAASDYFLLIADDSKTTDITLYVDTGNFVITPGSSHQRFLASGLEVSCGLIWRYNEQVWSIYDGSNWATSTLTDLSLFDNCTIKIYIDSSKYWHIYKNDTLILESSAAVNMGTYGIYLGSRNGQSISTGIIKAVRVYSGNYTE